MLMKTRIIIRRICGYVPCKRWMTSVPTGVAVLLGLFMFNVTTAQAVPVRVESVYGISNTVSTVAFFDDANKGGSGSGPVSIQVGQYFLTFSNFGPSTGVEADITSASFGITANFIDGTFIRFLGRGGISGAASAVNFALEIPNSRLVVNFRFTPQAVFGLQTQSELIPINQTTGVPEPGALALFGIGLVGLGVMRRRRKAV